MIRILNGIFLLAIIFLSLFIHASQQSVYFLDGTSHPAVYRAPYDDSQNGRNSNFYNSQQQSFHPYTRYSNHYVVPFQSPEAPRRQQQSEIILRRSAPEIVQQQRNEGNFVQQTNASATPMDQQQPKLHQIKKIRTRNGIPGVGYVDFEHKVLHVTTDHDNEFREKRNSHQQQTTNEGNQIQQSNDCEISTNNQTTPCKSRLQREKVQKFHDIFMHYAGPQNVAFGYVDQRPKQFTKRFESINNGNRHRGEVSWLDTQTGGYGSHYWDLAQGKL